MSVVTKRSERTEIAPLVMVADGDSQTMGTLAEQLSRWGYRVLIASNVAEFREQMRSRKPELIVMDVEFDGDHGLTILSRLLQQPHSPPVVVLTANACIDTAVEAIKLGAFDYIAKPANLDRLKQVVAQAIEAPRVKQHSTTEISDRGSEASHAILGTSAGIRRVKELIAVVAVTDAKVLILGESGTGKELVARAIHSQSQRADRTFAPVNMASLPPSLAESVLFGHEKGAFTGADMLQRGWCETADNGTLFLDEIGEMEMTLQAKLLRFLQDGTFQRVGSSKCQSVDVRIIAATNRDPAAMVREGRLREDLYYRLNVLPVVIPPLRDRREDIPLLAQIFLERAAKTHGRQGIGFSPAAMEMITEYDWPGNVRQLENTIERMAILCRGDAIGIADLPSEIVGGEPIFAAAIASSAPECRVTPSLEMRDIEREAIINALAQSNGNVVKAASVLGIGQATVYRKMKRYGIRVERRPQTSPRSSAD